MKRLFLNLIPWALAMLLTACGSSGSSYALIGVPGQYSYTDSTSILINNDQCSYVIYRGNGVTPPEVVTPCTLLADKKDALGNPHSTIEIGFNTAKGQQILSLHSTTTTNLITNSVPDIGVYLPNNWTVATPASNMTLKSNAPADIYSDLTVHINGVRCSLDVTAVANNKLVSMPCGLAFWGDTSVSISIPGALVSTVYAGRSWPLNFAKDPQSSNWNLMKVPSGFPVTYGVTNTTPGN